MLRHLPRPIADNTIVREELPLPWVYYPARHGTFCAFAPSRRVMPSLCECARQPLENLVRLTSARGTLYEDVAWAHLPARIAGRLTGWSLDRPCPIAFQPGLCHMCAGKAPTLCYCDETYGDPVTQAYGWYIQQTYLLLGPLPDGPIRIAQSCPPDQKAELETLQKVELALQGECHRLLNMTVRENGRRLSSAVVAHHNGKPADLRDLVELRNRASTLRGQLRQNVETMTLARLPAAHRSLVCS